MNSTELADGRVVEIATAVIEPIRVRVLPTGNVDRKNAAKYLNRSPNTLAMWAMEGKGPKAIKVNGRCFYSLDDLAAFIRGDEADD